MPSLQPGTPGTKEVFGLSLIREGGWIALPPGAVDHYGLADGDSLLLITTHHGEGGFAVARSQRAAQSVFARFMDGIASMDEASWQKGKAYALTGFSAGKIRLRSEILKTYHLETGQRLMVVKSTTVVKSCTPVEIWERKFAERGLRVAVENMKRLDLY